MRSLTQITTAVLLVGALGLGACAQQTVSNGALSGNVHFVGDPRVDRVVTDDGSRVEYTRSDLAVFQTELVNLLDDEEARIQWRATWYDDAGIQVNDPARVWHPILIPARASEPVRSVAPNLDAVRCEIQVQLINPIQD